MSLKIEIAYSIFLSYEVYSFRYILLFRRKSHVLYFFHGIFFSAVVMRWHSELASYSSLIVGTDHRVSRPWSLAGVKKLPDCLLERLFYDHRYQVSSRVMTGHRDWFTRCHLVMTGWQVSSWWHACCLGHAAPPMPSIYDGLVATPRHALRAACHCRVLASASLL